MILRRSNWKIYPYSKTYGGKLWLLFDELSSIFLFCSGAYFIYVDILPLPAWVGVIAAFYVMPFAVGVFFRPYASKEREDLYLYIVSNNKRLR